MAKTCPSCGYSPIGPFTDNCPICAEPVRYVRSDDAGGIAKAMQLSPLLVGGWVVIGVVLVYLFSGDWPWLLLSLGLCGAAWCATARAETLLLRLLGGSLLVLFLPGLWLASQGSILPGLDRREASPERFMHDMLAMAKGTSPEALRTCARMKTVSGIIYALCAVVAVPLAFLVPPLLNYRQRRKLGGPIYLSKPQALKGLLVWLLLLPGLGWLAWPMMQSWADAPRNPVQANWPLGRWPAGMAVDQVDAGRGDTEDPD